MKVFNFYNNCIFGILHGKSWNMVLRLKQLDMLGVGFSAYYESVIFNYFWLSKNKVVYLFDNVEIVSSSDMQREMLFYRSYIKLYYTKSHEKLNYMTYTYLPIRNYYEDE